MRDLKIGCVNRKVTVLDNFGARFGQRILDLRTDAGESQEEVALGAFGDGNAKTRISELETGKVARPQAKTVNALCAYFNISPTELAEIRRPKPTPPKDSRAALLEDYAKRLKRELDETRAQLEAAQSQALADRAEILEDRLADPEAALTEAEKTIEELRALLSRDGNELGGPLLTRARDALDHLDYREAEAVFEEIEAREEPHIARAARAAYARGVVAELDIRWADAAKHFGRAAGLNPTIENLKKAGDMAWRSGDYEGSLGFGSQRIKLCRSLGAEGLGGFGIALNDQAVNYWLLGDFAKAEPLIKDSLSIYRRQRKAKSADFAISLSVHALILLALGRYKDAEPLLLEALEIGKATIGTAHPDYAIWLNNLAELYRRTGRYEEAEPLALEALEIGKGTIGTAHPDYAIWLNNLALLYQGMGRFEEAESLFLEARDVTKAALGTAHPSYASRLNNLARLYEDTGRVAEAMPLIEEALAILKASLGEAHPKTQTSQKNRDQIAGKVAEDDG